ncbi:MAG: hypothetical protein Fues2KO_35920 [Fuerstiella sp.]
MPEFFSSCVAVAAAGVGLLSLRATFSAADRLKHTTALTAVRWMQVAIIGNVLVVLARLILPIVDGVRPAIPASLSYAGYASAVLLLAPLIAVLGARKPGAAAWPWFVILPLCLVLQWPSVSQLAAGGWHTRLEVPAPTAIGFLLVVVMGVGNYFGTRFTLQCLVGGIGLVLLLVPYTDWYAGSDYPWFGFLGLILVASSAVRFCNAVGQLPDWSEASVGDLWIGFRDVFGIVWAKRVMDRTNQLAGRERLNVHLTLDGFVSGGEAENHPTDDAGRTGQLMAWVLKRFFDESVLLPHLPSTEQQRPDRTPRSIA